MNSNDFPKLKHYAIIKFTSRSVYHPGDERSRTHPGHGYPDHMEEIKSIDYIPCNSSDEVASWIERHGKSSTYKVIEATPMSVTTAITLTPPTITREPFIK